MRAVGAPRTWIEQQFPHGACTRIWPPRAAHGYFQERHQQSAEEGQLFDSACPEVSVIGTRIMHCGIKAPKSIHQSIFVI